MFTLQQIDEIHQNFGQQSTLRQYLQALQDIGIVRYDSFLADGHSVYYATSGQNIASEAVHETLQVSDTGDKASLTEQLELHKQGKTNYLEMSRGLAASGVLKWTFDTINPTITYYDKNGNALLTESID